MKPDGVSTAALEPMEALESEQVNEAGDQAASPAEDTPPQPAGETGKGDTKPEQAKEAPAAKTGNKTSVDPKAKTATKTAAKTKPGAPSQTRPSAGSRPSTALSNGAAKPQTNGLAKKAPPAAVKKTTPTLAPVRKPTSTPSAPALKSKVGEKKPPGALSAASGAKSMTGTTAAARKTPTTATNGVKPTTTTTAAKRPAAPKPASAAPTRPSTAAPPKPPVSKTTRPSTGPSASPRPATGSSRPPTSGTARSSPAAAKPSTPRTSTTTRPAAPKPASSTPSGGKPPASLTSRSTTPLKKDVTKPTTPVSRTTAATRPSTTKSAKPETPKTAAKSDAAAKKPTAGKAAADPKTPSRPKTQESKAAPSKSSRPAATKATSPKKTVGSSTPTPVKRGPKSVAASEPEVAAAIAAAAAIASAAAIIAAPEEPQRSAGAAQEQAADITPGEVPVPVLESVREPTPEPIREPTPKPIREPTPEPIREPTPEPIQEMSPEPSLQAVSQPALAADAIASAQLSAQLDLFKFEDSANDSVPSLGTTVMSPPCSPPGPVSPVREPQNTSSLLDMNVQSDPWDRNTSMASSDFAPQSLQNVMDFQTEEEDYREQFGAQQTRHEEEEEKEVVKEKENQFMSTSIAPSADTFNMMAQPQSLMEDFTCRDLMSPQEKEEAVEKADEEINEDDDEEQDEDEEQRRLGHQPLSLAMDTSTSQVSEEFHAKSSVLGGSSAWPADDLLSGLDSEDVSSCTSSRQQGVSDLSSTQNTALLEGTQSSDALVDSSLRGSDADGNLMGSPNVETLANEEDEEDEEDERVDDMDLSSERVEEHHQHHKGFRQQEQDEEDEDVEMHSEGVTESCENVDEDDFNEEERVDNLNRSAAPPCVPPTSSAWGQTNVFSDPWAQPASLLSSHSPVESDPPTLSPGHARLNADAPSFVPRSERDGLQQLQSAHEELKENLSHPDSAPAARSASETSTPEELRDYDSSSGIESHSDKRQTPVPASAQSDMEQDLGIHLEKGDGEEEEAETLPADEVLGTGPPTAPASAPSSPSTSGDEASDTEGEMQINDPDVDAAVAMDESAGFDSPPPTSNLPALDEEADHAAAGEGEEDGGGATPQSANSVASYGFDCTTSNSNAHSMAESCGKSPGIFSLENEEQLSEEAKDPSLIKELTIPSPAAAAAMAGDDLLSRAVDLMPLGHPKEEQAALDQHHYMFGGKMAAEHLEDVDPEEPDEHHDTGDSQPPYYSTICDKTDSFLEGDEKTEDEDEDEDHKLQTHSQKEDNQNQNHDTAVPIANGHYLALVPGNRRPIDPSVAEHFEQMTGAPPLIESCGDGGIIEEQLRRVAQHQEKLREAKHRQEQERQKRQWLEEERLRLEQQKQLEKQRRELLQLQLQQQQHEHRQRRQVLQWQLELEQQYRMQQKHLQQQQQLRRSPTGVMLSPSSGLCTIYEAMETSDEEDEARGAPNRNTPGPGKSLPQDSNRQQRPTPPQELEWNKKVDMVQQLINQTLMLSGDGGCPPLLLLPVGSGGTLSPLESSMWPHLLPQFSPPAATVTSVSSFSPDSQGSSPPGDWTVVELETQH